MNPADQPDPMTAVLATFRLPEKTDFDNAWVGMEPTFQTKKSIKRWWALSETPEGEEAYFKDAYMLKTQKKVAKGIKKKYGAWRAERNHPYCMFEAVELKPDRDQWKVRRQNLLFHWADRGLEPFEVRLSLDPDAPRTSTRAIGSRPTPTKTATGPTRSCATARAT